MQFNPLITITLSTVATAAVLGTLPSSANAFTLVKMSSSWDNAELTNGLTVGADGVAPDASNFVEFLTVDNESQVRWGNPATGGAWVEEEKEVTKWKWKYEWKYEWKKNSYGNWYKDWYRDWYQESYTETVVENVYVPPSYDYKSGLGFTGVNDTDIEVGKAFNIGKLRHFNNPIYTPLGTQVDFSLDLEFAEAGLESQSFDFAFNIDETLNSQTVCPYTTDAGKGCSDSITWEESIVSSNTFSFKGEEYILELAGFSSSPESETLLEHFISQEQGTSEAYIFAQIAKVDKSTEEDPEKIPEPSAMVGVGLLGACFVSRRRNGEK